MMDGDIARLETLSLSIPTPDTKLGPRKPASESESKSDYPAMAAIPAQRGALGIRCDFNLGARVLLREGKWRIQNTGNIPFRSETSNAFIASGKRFYVRHQIKVWNSTTHEEVPHDAQGNDVLAQFPIGTLGDMLSCFSYAVKWQKQRGCKLNCAMGEKIMSLLRGVYQDIRFAAHEEYHAWPSQRGRHW